LTDKTIRIISQTDSSTTAASKTKSSTKNSTVELSTKSLTKFNSILEKSVAKMEKSVSSSVSKAITTNVKYGGGSTGKTSGGLKKSDIAALIKVATSEISNALLSQLKTALMSGGKVTGRSDADSITKALNSVDSNIGKSIDKLAIKLSKQGIDIDTSGLQEAVINGIKKSIPRDTLTATKELKKVANTISTLVKEISAATKEIKNISKLGSGGKAVSTSGTGFVSTISAFVKIGKLFPQLTREVTSAISSVKKLSKEQAQIASELEKSLSGIKQSVTTKVTSARKSIQDDPSKLFKKITSELLKSVKMSGGGDSTLSKNIVKLINTFEKTSDFKKGISELTGELKRITKNKSVSPQELKELIGAVSILNKAMAELPKSIGQGTGSSQWKKLDSTIQSFTTKTQKILKTLEVTLDDKEIKEYITQLEKKGITVPIQLKKIGNGFSEDEALKYANTLYISTKKALKAALKEANKESTPENFKYDVKQTVSSTQKVMKGGSVSSVGKRLERLQRYSDDIPEMKEPILKAKEAFALISSMLTGSKKEIDVKFKKLLDSVEGLSSAVEVKKDEVIGSPSISKDFADVSDKTKNLSSALKDKTGDVESSAKLDKGFEDVANKTKHLSSQIGKTIDGFEKNYPNINKNLKVFKSLPPVFPKTVIGGSPEGQKLPEIKSGPYGKKIEETIRSNVDELSKSLYQLQLDIITELESGFSKGKSGWEIKKDKGVVDPREIFKLIGGQEGRSWGLDIANVGELKRKLGKTKGSAPELVGEYMSKKIDDITSKTNVGDMAFKIGSALKGMSEAQISSLKSVHKDIEGFSKIKGRMVSLKAESSMSGEDISKLVPKSIKSDDELINVFKQTFARLEAERSMYTEKLLRSVTLPAAKLTEKGTAVFETLHGSNKSISKFATFESGFENLFKRLEKKLSTVEKANYIESIKGVSINPKGEELKIAEEIAKKMLKDVVSTQGTGGKQFVLQQYKKAAEMRGTETQRAGSLNVEDFTKHINETIKKLSDEGNTSLDKFITTLNNAGVSAYDVVKSLNKIDFENIYDIYKKVLVKSEDVSPISSLAKKPDYSRSIRNYEQAVSKVQGLLPLDPGTPRRGAYQQDVVNLFTRTSPVYSKMDKTSPQESKDLITGLNIALKDLYDEAALLDKVTQQTGVVFERRKDLPMGRQVSSLGVPETPASTIEEYRGKPFENPLNTLNTTMLKMYSGNLTEQSPFGKQFQQTGRNITNITNALAVSGKADRFPKLRTKSEREFRESGQMGTKGYGLNVIAELRNVSSTFEDQILISGELAKALTGITKTLIRPSAGGKLGSTLEEYSRSETVTDIKKGSLLPSKDEKTAIKEGDLLIKEAIGKIQEVLGISEKYGGRASEAFITEVKKTMTTIRGENVEVQSAKLAEKFMDYFGRKITTRYGSKGISIPSTKAVPDMASILSTYGGKIKVLPKDKAEEAGLGVAMMPKTSGKLLSEILEKYASSLDMSQQDVKVLQDKLIDSGNKFILDIFKTEGIIVPEEVLEQKDLFSGAKEALAKLGVNLDEGLSELASIANISKIVSKYKKDIGPELYEQTPIDVRISSHGMGKRGLQTEVMESVMTNVAGGRGATTMENVLTPDKYKQLLGTSKKVGALSKYSAALGYTSSLKGKVGSTERKEESDKLYKILKEKFGSDKEDMARRAADLEAASNYYVNVIDEFGKERKSLVGGKFVEIIKETTQYPAWKKGDIKSGIKGQKLNLPALSSYLTIFGKDSPLMKEIKGSGSPESGKHVEYLKALQVAGDITGDLTAELEKYLPTVDLTSIKKFEGSSGVFKAAGEEGDTDESVLNNTIMDLQKYSKAFIVALPTGQLSEGGAMKTEKFYVPGPLARGTYKESLLPGEFSPEPITRRLSHVINMAKKLQDAFDPRNAVYSNEDIQDSVQNIVGGWIKKSNIIAGKQDAMKPDTEQGISELQSIFSKMYKVLPEGQKKVDVDKRRKSYKEQMVTGKITQQKSMSNIINMMGDIIKGSRNAEDVSGTVLGKALSEGTGAELLTKLDIKPLKSDIDKKIQNLHKAKQDYFKELASTALGKKGSIAEVFFTKKIPAYMTDATVASVDRTSELEKFSQDLRNIELNFTDKIESDLSFMSKESKIMDEILKEHEVNISNMKKIGRPVLKQYEIGVPKEAAQKIPVTYTKKYDVTDKIIKRVPSKEVKGSLFDILKLSKKLKSAYKSQESGITGGEIQKYIESELVPYIESVRFPFTGTSSVQPYKAKLLKTEGGLGKHTLTAPGIPEMDFEKFDTVITKIKEKIGTFSKETGEYTKGSLQYKREKAYETSDFESINVLTELINKLNAAISAVLPKYIAQQQKLDFDGDQLEIHSATTAVARRDIKKHFDLLSTDIDSASGKFRDAFTYDAMVQSTGKYPIAEMSKSFEKKFEADKGFKFLKSPFLTSKLEYLKPEKQLEITGSKGDADLKQVLIDIVKGTVRNQSVQEKTIQAISSVKSSEDIGEYSSNLIKAVMDVNANIGALVKTGITNKLYNEKFADAITAQLFKLNTGVDVEGLNRIQRVGESMVGFGGGMISEEAYTPKSEFSSKWPDLKVLGENTAKEFHTVLNELYRFAVQKGMDVKHAGELPLAGEITTSLARGREGTSELFKKIETDKGYGDLKDFANVVEETIRGRAGGLKTETLRSELTSVKIGREEKVDVDNLGRAELIDELVKTVGFKGILNQIADGIYEDAVNGLITQAASWSPKKLKEAKVGDSVVDWANKSIKQQMKSEKGISLSSSITPATMPLYGMRTSTADRFTEQKKYVDMYGDVTSSVGKGMESSFATSSNFIEGLEKSIVSEDLGAYTESIKSSMNNIIEQQNQVMYLLQTLSDESFDINKIDISRGNLASRIMSGKDIASEFKDLFKQDDTGNIQDVVDKISSLAGTVRLPQVENLKILEDTLPVFTDYIDNYTIGTDEEREKRVKGMGKKAQLLSQLDTALKALGSKVVDPLFFSQKITPDLNIPENWVEKAKKVKAGMPKSSKKLFTSEYESISQSQIDTSFLDHNLPENLEKELNLLTDLRGKESLKTSKLDKATVQVSESQGSPNIPLQLSKGLSSGEVIPVNVIAIKDGLTIGISGDISRKLQTTASKSYMEPQEPYMYRGSIPTDIGSTGENISESIKNLGFSNYQEELNKYMVPPDIAKGSGISSLYKNIKSFHEQAKLYQEDMGISFKEIFEKIPKGIALEVEKAKVSGPDYNSFISKLETYKEYEGIKEGGSLKAWKLYRIAVGDFLMSQAEQAEKDLVDAESSGDSSESVKAYNTLKRSISRMQEFVKRGAGKRTDIYTEDKRFIYPGLAEASGVFMPSKEITKRASSPLEDDVELTKVYDDLIQDVSSGSDELTPPLVKARAALESLTNMDTELIKLMTDADIVKRLGPEIQEAWDFTGVSAKISRLRDSLENYYKTFELAGTSTSEQKQNIKDLISYFKNLESSYSKLDFNEIQSAGPKAWGQMDLIPVTKFEEPTVQLAKHTTNIKKVESYFKRPESEGGAKEDEAFTYRAKVYTDTGEVLKDSITNFKKYGETLDANGSKVGLFTKSQKDIIASMQNSNAAFGKAIKRVIMWGAASSLVYGGVNKLKQSLGEISDIETSIAQLRMVMNPLTTDFSTMEKTAVGFAKKYGVNINEVLKSMKVFAQQGLGQAEVLDRAKTATLAANVTTLNAKDATEALTASMKVFKSEGGGALRFLDAWSEVEARHAITSGDLADAIKKSASAAKNAGFTFDQLNGIVAAVGSTTRQTGKEIGTSLRFIMRRLFSEKGPKKLAEINIPVTTDEGALRSGFNILEDLAGAWKDLTKAQKLSIAQAIGGTRQYNSVLVLMDNWDEALKAIQHSTDSKGSAERRNLELMKTYAKQLEQTKAAATELQMSLGKVVLPVFKTGLKGMRMLFETITAIPKPLKIASAGLALFLTYTAKGAGIIDKLVETFSKGNSVFGSFGKSLSKQFNMAKFEIFGKGKKKDVLGLKTIFPSKDIAGNTLLMGNSINQFHSSLGKAMFVVKELGQQYNEFLSNSISGTAKVTNKIAQGFKTVGGFFSSIVTGKEMISKSNGGKLFDLSKKYSLGKEEIGGLLGEGGKGLATIAKRSAFIASEAVGLSSLAVGEALESMSGGMGDVGRKLAAEWSTSSAGMVKSVGPLVATVIALVPVIKSVVGYYKKMLMSSQDYEKSMKATLQNHEEEIQMLGEIQGKYKTLEKQAKDISKVSDPKTKERRMELGTYTSPLTSSVKIQKNMIGLGNELANSNLNLIVGYDKLGNAILRSTKNMSSYIKELKKIESIKTVETNLKILTKHIEDLTKVGGVEKFKYEFKELLSSAPIVGGMVGDKIHVSIAKVLKELTSKMNKLYSIKNKYPLSTAVDADIKKLQPQLDKARKMFNNIYSDADRIMKNITSEVSIGGLDRKDIINLFSDPELKKAYQLKVDVEPQYNLVKNTKRNLMFGTTASNRKFGSDTRTIDALGTLFGRPYTKREKPSTEDVMGAELLRRLNKKSAIGIGDTSQFTRANLESAGISKRKQRDEVKTGDIVLFSDEALKDYEIAGKQAIVKLKETTDGVYEWFVEYIDTKTLTPKEVRYSEVENLVDSIFPVRQVQDELENNISVLNTFTAGAAAGIKGISKKDFKRDFNLGSRFFSDIPTSTLLQSSQGYTQKGGFGEVGFMKNWKKELKTFYMKPMSDLKTVIGSYANKTTGGLKGENLGLAKGAYDEVNKLLTILNNNQSVIQFRAVIVDLMKEFEQSDRVLKESIAIEKSRAEVIKTTAGLMRGTYKDIANLDLGVSKIQDLTPQQSLTRNDAGYRRKAKEILVMEKKYAAAQEKVFKFDRAKVAVETIGSMGTGFGTTITKNNLSDFIENVPAIPDSSDNKLLFSNQNIAVNTKNTSNTLQSILESMVNTQSVDAVMDKFIQVVRQGNKVGPFTPEKTTLMTMEKISRIRDKAEKKGDNPDTVIAANMALDKLSTYLVGKVGIGKATRMAMTYSPNAVGSVGISYGKKHLKPAEIQQRALLGMDQDVLLKKMVDKSSKARKLWMPWKKEEKTKLEYQPEYKELIKIKNAGPVKKPLISTSTLMSGATGALVFASLKSGGTNKVIRDLDSRIAVLNTKISEATTQGKSPAAIKELKQQQQKFRVDRSSVQKEVNFYNIVKELSVIEDAALLFGKQLGFSENQVSKLGLATLGLAGAYQVASKVVGKEVPESAKKFVDVFSTEGGKLMSGQKIDIGALKDAGKELKSEYKTRKKEILKDYEKGNDYDDKELVSEIKNQIVALKDYKNNDNKLYSKYDSLLQKQLKERENLTTKYGPEAVTSKGYKDLIKQQRVAVDTLFKGVDMSDKDKIISEHPFFADMGRKVRKSTGEGSGFLGGLKDQYENNNAKIMLLIAAIMTATSYMSKKSEESGRLKDLSSAASKQSSLMFELIRTNPDIVNQLVGEMSKEEETRKKLPTKEQSLVFNVRSQQDSVINNLFKKQRDLAVEAVTLEGKKLEIAKALLETSYITAGNIKKSLTSFALERVTGKRNADIDSKFNISAILNKGLIGYKGDTEGVKQDKDLSTQQRVYKAAIDDYRKSLVMYTDALNEVPIRVNEIKQTLNDMQDQELILATSKQDPIAMSLAKDALKKYNYVLKMQAKELEIMTQKLNKFGQIKFVIDTFAESMNRLKDSIGEIDVQNAVYSLKGLQDYKDSMDKLFGGSHPEAMVRVSPDTERMGYRVGMNLVDRKSTKYDIEEARLTDQMRTATGKQRVDLRRQIFDLPTTRKRDILAREQLRENDILRRTLSPYESALTDLQKVLTLPGVDKDTSQQIKQLQDAIIKALIEAKDVTYVGDQPYYKGITGESKDLLSKSSEAIQSALQQKPTFRMSEMENAVTTPLVKELITIQNILNGLPTDNSSVTETSDYTPVTGPAFTNPVTGKDEFLSNPAFYNPSTGKEDSLFDSTPVKSIIKKYEPLFDSTSFKSIVKKDEPLSNPAFYNPSTGKEDSLFDLAAFKPIVKEDESKKSNDESLGSKISKLIDVMRSWTDNEPIKKQSGGYIAGFGGPKEDKIPAYLSNGEYIINTKSAKDFGYDKLDYINKNGKLPRFANGGLFRTSSDFMGENIDILKEKRLELAKEDTGFLGTIGKSLKMGALAGTELAHRVVKTPIDFLSGIEGVSSYIGNKFVVGGAKQGFKDIYSDVKGAGKTGIELAKVLTTKKGLKSAWKAGKSALGDEVSSGGLGLTTALLETVSGVGMAKAEGIGKSSLNLLDTVKKKKILNITPKDRKLTKIFLENSEKIGLQSKSDVIREINQATSTDKVFSSLNRHSPLSMRLETMGIDPSSLDLKATKAWASSQWKFLEDYPDLHMDTFGIYDSKKFEKIIGQRLSGTGAYREFKDKNTLGHMFVNKKILEDPVSFIKGMREQSKSGFLSKEVMENPYQYAIEHEGGHAIYDTAMKRGLRKQSEFIKGDFEKFGALDRYGAKELKENFAEYQASSRLGGRSKELDKFREMFNKKTFNDMGFAYGGKVDETWDSFYGDVFTKTIDGIKYFSNVKKDDNKIRSSIRNGAPYFSNIKESEQLKQSSNDLKEKQSKQLYRSLKNGQLEQLMDTGPATKWGQASAYAAQQRVANYEELSEEERNKSSFMGIFPMFNTERYKKSQIRQEEFKQKLIDKRKLNAKDIVKKKRFPLGSLSELGQGFEKTDYQKVLDSGDSDKIRSTFGNVAGSVVQAKKNLGFINTNIDMLGFNDKQKAIYNKLYKEQNEVLNMYEGKLRSSVLPSRVKFDKYEDKLKNRKEKEQTESRLASALKNENGIFSKLQLKIRKEQEKKLTGLENPFMVFKKNPKQYIELKKAVADNDQNKIQELTKLFKIDDKVNKMLPQKQLKRKDHVSSLVMGKKKTDFEKFVENVFDFKYKKDEVSLSTTKVSDQLNKIMMDSLKNFNKNQSLPVYHNGGVVSKTGPLFAEQGEFIVPKKFAEGGQVSSGLDGLQVQSMNSQKIVLDYTDFITELEDIKLMVDDTPIKVATDVPIPVDLSNPIKVEDKILKVEQVPILVEQPTWKIPVEDISTSMKVEVEQPSWKIDVDVPTDSIKVAVDMPTESISVEQPTWKIPVEDISTSMKVEVEQPSWKIDVDVPTDSIKVAVDMPTESIKIDVTDAASKLASTISNAISTSTIKVEDTGGNSSVGADRLDTVARAISDVNDKLITSVAALKTNFDGEIEVLNRKSDSSVDMDVIQNRIKEEVGMEMDKYNTIINESKSSVDELRSRVVNTEQTSNYKIDEIYIRLNQISNRI